MTFFWGWKYEYAKLVPAFWRRVVRSDVHTCSPTWRNAKRARRPQIPSRYAVECTKSCRSPWTSCRGVASGRPSLVSLDQLQHPPGNSYVKSYTASTSLLWRWRRRRRGRRRLLAEIMRPNILFDVRGACSSVIVHDMWARLFWLMCIKCCSGVRCCAKIIFRPANFAPNADESTSTLQCERPCVRDPAPLGFYSACVPEWALVLSLYQFDLFCGFQLNIVHVIGLGFAAKLHFNYRLNLMAGFSFFFFFFLICRLRNHRIIHFRI